MIVITLILAQVVGWELLLPNQGFDPYARNPLTFQGDTLVFAGGRYEPLSGMGCWGFCSGVDTANGAILWDREFLGYEKSQITALARGQGCFYVAGQCRSPFGYWDIFAAKMDFSGNLIWERISEIPESDGLVVSAMVDPKGNLVVVGIRWEKGEDIDIALVSWDEDGNQRWNAAYDSPWHMDDVGWSSSMDEEGSSYVVGYYTGPVKKGERWSTEPMVVRHDGNIGPEPALGPPDTCYSLNPLVIKVDSSGNLVWVDDCEYWTVGGEFMFAEYSYGRLYVSGFECTGNLYTECLDKYGQQLWHAWEYDNFMTIDFHGGCVDVNGNLYLTGKKCNPGPEAFVVSYSAYGQRRFINMVFQGYGLRVAVDPWGNLFIGGSVIDSVGQDFMVAKLDTLGNLKWLYRKDDGTPDTNQPDECYGLLPDLQGGVFAMGVLYDSAMTPIQYIVHLADTTGEVSEHASGTPGLTILPSPSGFWISGYEGEAQIYDPAGRLVIKKEIRGKTLVRPLSPGVYFVVAGKERAKVAVR